MWCWQFVCFHVTNRLLFIDPPCVYTYNVLVKMWNYRIYENRKHVKYHTILWWLKIHFHEVICDFILFVHNVFKIWYLISACKVKHWPYHNYMNPPVLFGNKKCFVIFPKTTFHIFIYSSEVTSRCVWNWLPCRQEFVHDDTMVTAML